MTRRIRNGRKAAITGVLSTAIGILIFFAVIIPTWLYMQQLQTIFMDEVNRRLIFEAEKLRERVQVEPYINPEGSSYRLLVRLTNLSPLESTVTGLYAESSTSGIVRLSENPIILAPAESRLIRTEYLLQCPSPESCEVLHVRASTARGNSFLSAYAIGPMRLPYVLVLSLANLTVSTEYVVTAEVKEGSLGCISRPTSTSGEIAPGCTRRVEVARYIEVRSSSEGVNVGREEVFYFNVAPGNYTVKVNMVNDQGVLVPVLSLGDLTPITVLDDTIVRVNARIDEPWGIVLRLSSPVSRLVLLNSSNPDQPLLVNFTFFVHYDPRFPGPMVNVTSITLTISSESSSGTCQWSDSSGGIYRLIPGDTVPVTFKCELPQNEPTKYVITVSIDESAVEIPGEFRLDSSNSVLIQKVTVLLCRVNRITVVTGISASTVTTTLGPPGRDVLTYINAIEVQTTVMQAVNCPSG
ncbi:MAG: hypothetical protein QXP81_02220 [Nitrososphaerota archaeon]|nr:hypothetical protein [Candidatus Calditenuis fumarioli]